MTKKEAANIIVETATRYGFKAEGNGPFGLPWIREDGTRYLNFNMLTKDIKFDNGNMAITYRVSYSASLASMGGNPTPDDLLQAADIIRRGAELLKELEAMNIVYVEKIG